MKKLSYKNFHNISINGRFAFGVCCIENVFRYLEIHDKDSNLLLGKLWEFVTLEKVDDWYAEVIENFVPHYIMDNVISQNKNRMPKTMTMFYQKIPQEVVALIDNVFWIGLRNLFSSVGKDSPLTLEMVQATLDIMYTNNWQIPDISQFMVFKFETRNGWGNILNEAELHNLQVSTKSL